MAENNIGIAGDIESPRKILGVVHAFVAGHAEPGHQRMRILGDVSCCFHHRIGTLMAQARGDHARFDAGGGLGAPHAFRQSLDIGARRKPGADRMVGGDEYFRIDRVLRAEGQ